MAGLIVPRMSAATESALRTLLQAGLGAAVGYLSANQVDSPDRAWVMGLVSVVTAALLAAGMRIVAPIQTDYAGKHVAGVKPKEAEPPV